MKTPVVCIIGPTASGNSTQAQLLAKSLGFRQVTIARVLAAQSKESSTFGKRLNDLVKRGAAIPAEMIEPVLHDVFLHAKQGVVFDGFPRTPEQAELLVKSLSLIDLVIIEISLSDKEVKERIKQRLSKPGYKPQIDDDLALVEDKLMLYNASKRIIEKKLLKSWEDSKADYFQVTASNGSPEALHDIILGHVKSLKKAARV